MVEVENSIQKYPAYKDSGVEWLGEIPEHWEVKRLASFGKFLKGGGFSKADLIDDGVLAIIYGDIYTKYNISIKKELRFISIETAKKSINIDKHDLLFTGSGETMEDIGKCVVFDSDKIAYAGSDIIIFKQTENDSLFLSFILNTEGARFEKARYSKGEIIVHTYGSKLRNIYIPIPTLKEQTAIAQFLDDKTTKIEEAIAIKTQQINLLKERKQILIHKAVTRGLNPNVKLKDSGVEWIGEIPEHWEVKRLKFSTKIFRGKFTHRPRNDERLYDGKYPFFQTGDVARAGKYLSIFKQTLNEKGLRVSTLFPKGTIVITIAANIGDISILDIDACFPDSIVGFEPNVFVEKHFLYNSLLVMKEQFMSSTIKNTQMNLNVDRIGSNSIAIPPISEQKEIAEYIETASQKIETAITLKKQEIEKLKEYKSSLINSAVTGKIKVF